MDHSAEVLEVDFKGSQAYVCSKNCTFFTHWMTWVRSPAEEKEFSSSLCVQTSSEAHPASYPMGTRGTFPRGKVQPGHNTSHPHLEPRYRMSRNYTPLPLGTCMAVAGQLSFYFMLKLGHNNKMDVKETGCVGVY
jgi:hypothetical protein